MGLALAVAAGLSLPGWLRLALIGIAVVALHLQASGVSGWRVVSFGLPGAMLVTAAVSARRPERVSLSMRGLVRLGDASYAMYLFHPFIMRGFTLLGARFGAPTEASGVLYVLLSLITAQASALAINVGFERKLAAMLRNRRRSEPAKAY
jgi:peptidoglycan/LPS O-acetylase OafA/YrhL